MKLLILLLFFSIVSMGLLSHATNPPCPGNIKKELVRSIKDNRPHSYFVRCHPKLPLGFSNENQPDGSNPIMTPVIINLKTGLNEKLKLQPGESAEDLTPTPDGKFLVTQITGNKLNALGLYKIDDAGNLERVGLLKSQNEKTEQSYFYPSTAIRNNEYLVAVRTMYLKEGEKRPLSGIFINKIINDSGTFKTEIDTQVCSNIDEFDRPYLSLDASFIGGAAKGEMGIYRVDWQKRQGNKVPCTLVRKLPSTAGKVSFSPSNRYVVFHADELSFLGRTKSQDDSLTQSYLHDIQTGQLTKISEDRKGMASEFPYFCSEEQILMRSVRFGKNNESVFDLVNIRMEPNRDCNSATSNSNTKSSSSSANR